MDDCTFSNVCVKLGRPSLLRLTGTVCGLGGTQLPVIGETELHLTDTETIQVLVAKDFPNELLLGSDAISQGQGKIDYAKREMTWFGKSFQITPYTDSLQAAASVYDSCGHPSIDEVMRGYSDTDDDLSNLGHCDLIQLTVNVDGHRPIRQRAYRTPLPKRKVVDDQIDEMLKDGVIQESTSPWAAPVTLTSKKVGRTGSASTTSN